MESSIKVDFRDLGVGKGFEPVILVRLVDSEDARDRLLKSFFQSLAGQSSWLVVTFDHHIISDPQNAKTYITLAPVTPADLKETARMILSRMEKDEIQNYNPIKDKYHPEER